MANIETNGISTSNKKLFWACFVALSTIAFGFILRALTLPQWAEEFNLTNTQIGEIAGAGLWPFAISIILISLFVDRIGYKNAMMIAFACHVATAVLTYLATGYWSFYIATLIMALGNGIAGAVINPVVASMYTREKTKWLNILHAGWPAGLILGGILALLLGAESSWRIKMILILIPTIIYAFLMFPRKFPINERVKAGVSYLSMLKEVGILGALVVSGLIVSQLGSIFEWQMTSQLIVILIIVSMYGYFVRSIGQPIFILLLLMMIPLDITELGTDSWITDLMAPEMKKMGLQAGWILVYTAAIMIILRLAAGFIIRRITPLGLLAGSSAIACVGLLLLSFSSGAMILLAATIFGIGKTFMMPTMLGVVAERYPKGGALTINVTSGVGLLSAGVIGAVILGFIQDTYIDRNLKTYDLKNNTNIHQTYTTSKKPSIFGEYQALDFKKLDQEASNEIKETVENIQEGAKKDTLSSIAIFPFIMLMGYIFLIFYFRSKGGYKAVILHASEEGR